MAGITSEQYTMFSFLQFHSGSIWITEKVLRLSQSHKLLCICGYFLKSIFLWNQKKPQNQNTSGKAALLSLSQSTQLKDLSVYGNTINSCEKLWWDKILEAHL